MVVSEEKVIVVFGVYFMFVDLSVLMFFIVVDLSVVVFVDFVCGGNNENIMCKNVNWVGEFEIVDLRNVVFGDVLFDGNGILEIKCGIEVGYIF